MDASYPQIAEATGIPMSTAYHNLKKDEINQLIKDCQLKLIASGLKKSVDHQIAKIESSARITAQIDAGADKLPAGAVKLMELGHDAEKQILQSVGIHNAHTQSITLNQIMIDARSELSPAIERMLAGHLGGEAIDMVDTSDPVDK